MTTTMPDRTAELERKIDQLTEQVAFIAAEAEIMRERRESWDELRADFAMICDTGMFQSRTPAITTGTINFCRTCDKN